MKRFDLDILPRKKGVYIVGGSLRDSLLGRTPKDLDIAVHGDPEPFARELANKLNSRVIVLGRQPHPMYRVVTQDRIFDISPLQGTTIEEDLGRRDFTVNALACEILSTNIIDISQGLQDIQNKKIRQVTKTSFQTDPLRLVRAFRIAAQLGFQIEKQTLETIQKEAHLISKPAAERVRSELSGLLGASGTHEWLQKTADTGVLFHILPEMAAMQGCLQNEHHDFDVFGHTIQTVRHVEALMDPDPIHDADFRSLTMPMDVPRKIRLKLAALLHDIGKPLNRHVTQDGHIGFVGHESIGAQMVADIGERLRFSRNAIGHAVKMVQYHLRPLFLFKAEMQKTLTPRGITRFFMQTDPFTRDLLLLSLADMRAKKSHHQTTNPEFERFIVDLTRRYIIDFRPSLETPSLISGHDLTHCLHLSPSPLFKQILARTRESQLAGEISTREEALKFAADVIAAARP